jgi:hypothetical protein
MIVDASRVSARCHPDALLFHHDARWLSLATVMSLVGAQLHPSKPAEYRKFPSLREQTRILGGWREERVAGIPALLEKHGVDVWLVNLSTSYLARVGDLIATPICLYCSYLDVSSVWNP